MVIFENIVIDIDIDKEVLENIDINIDKEISENIDIDKIWNRLEFGISNRASKCAIVRKQNNILQKIFCNILQTGSNAKLCFGAF